MKHYTLVNPQVQGTIDTKFQAKSSRDAGLHAYKTISGYFSNNVPEFSFTLKQGDNFHHFRAKEKISDSGKIKYTVKEDMKITDISGLQKFIKESTDDLQGGKHSKYDDSSSSSSSSSSSAYDYYGRTYNKQPIYYWKYYPRVYPYQYYYFPQFVAPLSPYVYVKFSD